MRTLLVLVLMLIPIHVMAADTVTLTWTPNTEVDLAGYKVYRSLTVCPTTGPLPGPPLKDVGKVVTFIDSTIPLGTVDVCYALTAYNLSLNESTQSNKVGKKFVVAVPLPAITNFKYTVDTFTWDVMVGAKSYLVRVHEEGTPYEPCSSMIYCNVAGALTTNTLKLVLKSGKKYDGPVPDDKKGQSGAHGREQLPLITDPVKAQSAAIFYEVWQKAKKDKTYQQLLQKHKEQNKL